MTSPELTRELAIAIYTDNEAQIDETLAKIRRCREEENVGKPPGMDNPTWEAYRRLKERGLGSRIR